MGDFSILAIRIKELRASMKKTQREFAKFVGCTAATLSAYENGSKSPSLEIVKNVAEKCGVSIDWLCGITDKKEHEEQPKTYADMFRIIIKLCNISIGFDNWEIFYEKNDYCDMSHTGIPFAVLKTSNNVAVSFFKDWVQMYKLYTSGTIDKHLYKLWISDRIKQYEDMNLEIPIVPPEE